LSLPVRSPAPPVAHPAAAWCYPLAGLLRLVGTAFVSHFPLVFCVYCHTSAHIYVYLYVLSVVPCWFLYIERGTTRAAPLPVPVTAVAATWCRSQRPVLITTNSSRPYCLVSPFSVAARGCHLTARCHVPASPGCCTHCHPPHYLLCSSPASSAVFRHLRVSLVSAPHLLPIHPPPPFRLSLFTAGTLKNHGAIAAHAWRRRWRLPLRQDRRVFTTRWVYRSPSRL